jgi:DNA-binding transcriptional ArsR family regulator
MPARSVTSSRGAARPARAANSIKPHAAKAAELLKALANEQRLMILCNLLEGPLSVGEINEQVDLSQSALSQHLAVLRESGVVLTTREAQTIRYSLPEGVVTRIIGILYKEFCGS